MKLICLAAFLGLFATGARAQSIRYSLQYNSTNNNFEVYLTPSGFAVPTINIGTGQVTVVFENPNAITGQASIATTAIAAGSWTDQDYVFSPGSGAYVGFQTTGAPTAITNGTPVLLFTFTVSAAGGNCAGRLRLFANATDNPDPTGVGADFQSYVTVGLTDYFSTTTSTGFQNCVQLITLPVKFLGFLVRKDGDRAVLDWTVTAEDNKTSHYEIERSADGINFFKLATVTARRRDGIQSYTYADEKISTLRVKKLYFRVKQFDLDGKSVQTNVGTVDLLADKQETLLFPNPANEGFTLSMPYAAASQKKVQLHLVNTLGQIVEQRSITRQAATNYYYGLQNSLVVSGDYLLRIYEDGQLTETKRVVVKK